MSTLSSAKSDARVDPCVPEDQETGEQSTCLQQLRNAIQTALAAGEVGADDLDRNSPAAIAIATLTQPWRDDKDLQEMHLALSDAMEASDRVSSLGRPRLPLPPDLLPLLP